MKTNYLVVTSAVALFALLGFVSQNPRALGQDANCSSPVKILKAVEPDIPASVARAHPNAEVTLAVTVTAYGHPSAIETVKATPSLDETTLEAILHAARDSTYKPEIKNCKAVSGGKYLFHVEIGP